MAVSSTHTLEMCWDLASEYQNAEPPSEQEVQKAPPAPVGKPGKKGQVAEVVAPSFGPPVPLLQAMLRAITVIVTVSADAVRWVGERSVAPWLSLLEHADEHERQTRDG